MQSAVLFRALSLVAGAAALGLVTNAARPGGVALASFAPPTECTGPHEGAGAARDDLSPADAAQLCGQPGVVVADARPAGAFAEGHVAGAVHLPCDAGDAGEALTHFDRAQRIVVYGATSEDARPVADSLRGRHPNARVQVLAGGFAAWSSAGLACASGPCDECKAAAAAAATTAAQSGLQSATSGAAASSTGTAAPSTGAAASSTGAASAGATTAKHLPAQTPASVP
ncbi:MAG TPA: rhodanese-like domain-containing protein [Polyangia bacterium]|jgi:rhodanese-related sulfurtransferase|nr:rhodanese-like domain-containing protein [Polyangia bacterium]